MVFLALAQVEEVLTVYSPHWIPNPSLHVVSLHVELSCLIRPDVVYVVVAIHGDCIVQLSPGGIIEFLSRSCDVLIQAGVVETNVRRICTSFTIQERCDIVIWVRIVWCPSEHEAG